MLRRAAVLLAAVLTAGCGYDRTPPPAIETAAEPRGGEQPFEARDAGVGLEAPGSWRLNTARQDRRLATVTSGRATIAVWHYPRTEPLPADAAALAQARDALVERVRRRDPTFELGSAELTRVDGARAIELTGAQTISGQRVQVRSVHVFHAGSEIVLDAYAPPATFRRVDGRVFRPLIASVELSQPA